MAGKERESRFMAGKSNQVLKVLRPHPRATTASLLCPVTVPHLQSCRNLALLRAALQTQPLQ